MLDRPTDNPDPERKGGPSTCYAFPTRSRCPNPDCRSLDTVARSTQGRQQHRKCRDCGWTYKVLGSKM